MACYLVADVEVHDPEKYKEYSKDNPPLLKKYGGWYVARSQAYEVLEGNLKPKRFVIMGFPDKATLLSWYNSPEYQKLLPIRHANSTGNLIIVEGAD
ncbi:MAG: DUF1330 domain-containing protein [Alphaproteobacteria bacterium]|nr:DUF1330 domain-containing protein [Alphaproteobacteria bacterium]